jgi:hypothetical protein
MMLTAIEGRWDDLMRMQLVQDKMLKILFSKANITFSELAKNNLSEIHRLNQNILDETNNKMGRVEELRMAS